VTDTTTRPIATGTNRTGAPRLPGLDVTRAVALIGVAIMNYHGYLNGGQATRTSSFAEHVFDTDQGPLSTRFAATFVLVAGMGVTLLTNRSRLSGDRAAIRDDRWRLIRRGVLLYAFGFFVEWIWNGTILFYYGAFFVVAALLFTLSARWLVAIGSGAALAGAGIAWKVFEKALDGDNVQWLDPRHVDSPRELLIRTFIGYTHPLLPWVAFLCAGIILGRWLPLAATRRRVLVAAGAAMFAGTYAINFVGLRLATHNFTVNTVSARRWRKLLSTGPFDRGLLYTIGTLGSSLVAFCLIAWVSDRFPTARLTRLFQHAGQMTLTLYLCHVLVFNAVVNWWHLVRPTGLDTALVFAITFWIGAIAAGAAWHRWLGMGPLERLYRAFGG